MEDDEKETIGFVGKIVLDVYNDVFCMNCGKTFWIITSEKIIKCPYCGHEVEAIV